MNEMPDMEGPQSVVEMFDQALSPDQKRAIEDIAPLTGIIIESLHLRAQHQLSQSDVAHAMGSRQSVISRFENMGRKPSYEFLVRFARALGGQLGLTLNGQYCAVAPAEYRASIDALAERDRTTTNDIVLNALTFGLQVTVPVKEAASGVTANDHSIYREPEYSSRIESEPVTIAGGSATTAVSAFVTWPEEQPA